MTRENAFANLRNVLAELYPDRASARRTVDDAGLNDAQIDFTGSTIDTWHAILRKAEHTNKLDALFTVVTNADEYGGNQNLLQAIDAYRRKVAQEQAIPRVQALSRERAANTKEKPTFIKILQVLLPVIGTAALLVVAYSAYQQVVAPTYTPVDTLPTAEAIAPVATDTEIATVALTPTSLVVPTAEIAKDTAIAKTTQEAEQAVVSETAVITATVELQAPTQQPSDEVGSLHYGESAEGEIKIVGEQDYFDFEGQRGDLITILVEFPIHQYLYLYLTGPNGPVAACDRFQASVCKFERLELPDTGTYRITVDGYETITTNYTLSIAKLRSMNP